MDLTFHIVPAHGSPFEYVPKKSSVIVGRSSESDLLVDDQYLSRKHARIYRKNGRWMLEDLGSQNGTWHNRRRVQRPEPIGPGSIIKLSSSIISVKESGSEVEVFQEKTPSNMEKSYFTSATELLDLNKVAKDLKEDAKVDPGPYFERFKLLNEIHHLLGTSIEIDQLLEVILDKVFVHLRPEEGVIYLKNKQGMLYSAARRSNPGEGRKFVHSRHLEKEVVGKGMAALVYDAEIDERFSKADSIVSSGIRSLVAAPLLGPDETLGMIVLDSRAGVRMFSLEDMELLVSLASVAALWLRNLALAEENVRRRRMEEELELARNIQMALIPHHFPVFPGYEIFGGNDPSRGVSGDYFQILERRDGEECVFLIADVSGKGVSASLLTASLEALAASPLEDGLPPDEVCTKLSRMLFRRTPPERYATMFLAVLERESGRVQYANAGHNPALLVKDVGDIEELPRTGLPIGLLRKTECAKAETRLDRGDLLVLYTDGITETANPDGEEYGVDRLRQQLYRHRQEALSDLADRIHADLLAFAKGQPFADDRTLVMVRRVFA